MVGLCGLGKFALMRAPTCDFRHDPCARFERHHFFGMPWLDPFFPSEDWRIHPSNRSVESEFFVNRSPGTECWGLSDGVNRDSR
jgi:hypothetical protein